MVRRRMGVSCSFTGDFVDSRQRRMDGKGVNMGLGILRVPSSSSTPLEDGWLQFRWDGNLNRGELGQGGLRQRRVSGACEIEYHRDCQS